jgi:hypothetical protein
MGEPTSLFVPGFRYKGVSRAVTGEDWLYLSAHGAKWTDVVVLAVFENSSWGAVALEGVDPTGGLEQRVSWLLRLADGRIQELIETVQVVE